MSTYIVIDEDIYTTNTADEIEEAKAALREAGAERAVVFAGEPDGAGDAYPNGQVLFAD